MDALTHALALERWTPTHAGDIRHTQFHCTKMTPFRWNHDKNKQLKAERGISFAEAVLAIEAGGMLDVVRQPKVSLKRTRHEAPCRSASRYAS